MQSSWRASDDTLFTSEARLFLKEIRSIGRVYRRVHIVHEITFLVSRNFPRDKVSNGSSLLLLFLNSCSLYLFSPSSSFYIFFLTCFPLLSFFFFFVVFCFVPWRCCFSVRSLPHFSPFSRILFSPTCLPLVIPPFYSSSFRFFSFIFFFRYSFFEFVWYFLGFCEQSRSSGTRGTDDIYPVTTRMIKISALFSLSSLTYRFRMNGNGVFLIQLLMTAMWCRF